MSRHSAPTGGQVWQWFEQGAGHHRLTGLYDNTERAHRFFLGEQWYGVESGGEALPQYNFIQPIVEHKVASVAMNNMTISYTPLEHAGQAYQRAALLCRQLTTYAARQWERLKMDKLCWSAVRDACVAGDGYLYFYDGDCHAQQVDTCNLYLADEQCADLQKQEYILIAGRQTVGSLRREARRAGLRESDVEKIVPDDGQWEQERERQEAARDEPERKCTALLLFWRDENGIVCCQRSTRDVVYRPAARLCGSGGRGLRLYPVAGLSWLRRRGSALGGGGVQGLIANQIETNKMLARRLMNAKVSAFSRLVYNADKVMNKEAVEQVGAAIKVRDMQASSVSDIVTYLGAAPMSPDARQLSEELVTMTRELAGAGNAALGQVNPELASGAAIIAARDQAALPLNGQIADFRQFIEDVAAIWFELWCAYYPRDLQEGPYGMDAEELGRLQVEIRIDVAPNNPLSRYAQEQALENLFARGSITLEEYVEALDETAAAPKQKLEGILESRRQGATKGKPGGGFAPAPSGAEDLAELIYAKSIQSKGVPSGA